ncbi:hypothetical protein SDC9_197767 [bioreactor metagenome]|uniref:Uncharacterized protein n=1 Tax=bioreactor metagenome TaxID=1076179 RepID=A0A645IFP4_9ZZZZ
MVGYFSFIIEQFLNEIEFFIKKWDCIFDQFPGFKTEPYVFDCFQKIFEIIRIFGI